MEPQQRYPYPATTSLQPEIHQSPCADPSQLKGQQKAMKQRGVLTQKEVGLYLLAMAGLRDILKLSFSIWLAHKMCCYVCCHSNTFG